MSCPFRSPPANTRRSFGCGRALRRASSCAPTMPTRGSASPAATASFNTVRRAGCGSGTQRRCGGSLIPGLPAAEERVGDAPYVKCALLLRGRGRGPPPRPSALGPLPAARHVLDEEKPGARERLGVTPHEVHVSRAVAVALGQTRARIAPALALRAVARQRNEGAVEVHELVRIGGTATEAPRGVRRQRGEELQAPDTAQLVA